jgi:peptidoglycan biosynthesis protein MviN/MurJ (putative lipid II flippase)
MNKRNTATVLWFAMGWTVGSILAIMVGLPTIVGVLMGIPFAWFIRVGLGRRVWSTRIYTDEPARSAPEGSPLATE